MGLGRTVPVPRCWSLAPWSAIATSATRMPRAGRRTQGEAGTPAVVGGCTLGPTRERRRHKMDRDVSPRLRDFVGGALRRALEDGRSRRPGHDVNGHRRRDRHRAWHHDVGQRQRREGDDRSRPALTRRARGQDVGPTARPRGLVSPRCRTRGRGRRGAEAAARDGRVLLKPRRRDRALRAALRARRR